MTCILMELYVCPKKVLLKTNEGEKVGEKVVKIML